MRFQGKVNFDIKIKTNYTNLPKSFYDKITQLHLLNPICETTCSTFKMFFFEAPSKEIASTTLSKEFAKFCNENNIMPFNVKYDIVERTIIDTSNAHDEALVDTINYIWCRDSESFKPILLALYTRDMEEAIKKEIDPSLIGTDFESFAYEFMMKVCDDMDLAVIIDFIRFREDITQ